MSVKSITDFECELIDPNDEPWNDSALFVVARSRNCFVARARFRYGGGKYTWSALVARYAIEDESVDIMPMLRRMAARAAERGQSE